MKIPVLTYHTAFIGSDYATNNLVAFSEDLLLIDALGFRIVPLPDVVESLLTNSTLPDKAVSLSLDDGTDFDYCDLQHPVFGKQQSAHHTLRKFVARFGATKQPTLHATSFVIVSPTARKELDECCLIGARWYNDEWWPRAAASHFMGIANHSWDHNHPQASSIHDNVLRGTFGSIDNATLADYQIRQAQRYLVSKAPNTATSLFAYPYGETNDYLVREYFPRFATELGMKAAFGTVPAPITESSTRWNLPRFVFGSDWTTPEELTRLLQS